MQITRNSTETRQGPADWFTGDIYIDTVCDLSFAPLAEREQSSTSPRPRAPP